MCTAPNGGTWKAQDLFTRPHRFFGLPSLIDPILHPNDKYNKPKVEEPDPVIERQAYVSPLPRTNADSANRRRIAGLNTSSQGLMAAASTTATPLPVGGGGG